MSEQSWPYAGDAVTEAEWSAMARLFREVGVVVDVGGQLSVSAVGGQVQVTVAAGEAFIEGFYYRNDETVTLDLDTADLNQDRIDLVVVRSDRGEGEARLAVKTGTPAAEPEAPAVVQDHDGAGVYELALAEVNVPAASAEPGVLVDVRRFSQVVGGVQFVTTAERDELDQLYVGRPVFNTDVNLLEVFDGTQWRRVDQPDIDTAPLRAEYLEGFAETNLRLWQLEADVIQETEGFTGWTGEAFLTNQDEVASVTGDVSISRAARLGGGGLSIAASPLIGVEIGDPFMGGFFAGIIDTTQSGAILAEDQYQTPLRYALIVSPRSLQTDLEWRTTSATVVEAQTRWNGLAAQDALASATFPAFNYCAGLSHPADDASGWYLPALDELTEAYWNLKPTTGNNSTGTRGSDFPDDDFNRGELFSTDPQRPPFTAGTPEQTSVADFQEGGDEEFLEVGGSSRFFWSASWASSSTAWSVGFSTGNPDSGFTQTTTLRVRPVRRLVL